MRKIWKVLAGLILTVLAALVIIPFLFKDKIKELVLEEFAKQTTATLYFSEVSLSAFRSFPDLDFGIEEFGIVGTAVFEGDTLVSSSALHTTLGLKELILENQLLIKEITITKPLITLISLRTGEVNYDIMRSEEEIEEETSDESPESSMVLSLDQVQIKDGQLVYFDQDLQLMIDLAGINLLSSATYKDEFFDFMTTGAIDDIDLIYQEIPYVKNKSLDINAAILADLKNNLFTFEENQFRINSLPFNIDGTFEMLAEDAGYFVDFSFDSPQGTFKDMLSLVPGVFSSSFEQLTADGQIDFGGKINGLYSEYELPSISLFMNVKEGTFSYVDVPEKIQDFNMNLQLKSEKGQLEQSQLSLSRFDFSLSENPFQAQMTLKNFENPTWNLAANGSVDLNSLAQLIPSSYELEGLISLNINSTGDLNAIDAQQYEELVVTGDLILKDFELLAAEIPQQLSIENLNAEFSLQEVLIKNLKGEVGSTSFNAEGSLDGFVPYMLRNELLTGTLEMTADQFILNDWMTNENGIDNDEVLQENDNAASLGTVRIPENIDFTLSATLGKLDYDGLILKDVNADLKVKDGQVQIENSGFDLIEGSFRAKGLYDSRPKKPAFNMDLQVASISIPKSFDQFMAVQQFAPITQQMSGDFGFDFSLDGVLGEDMMPDYTSLKGSGLIQIARAGLQRSELTQGLSSTLKVAKIDNVLIEKANIEADILDGRLYVKPFDTRIGDYFASIGGSTGLDGSINYELLITVPAKELSQQVNALAKQYLGTTLSTASEYVFDLSMKGTYKKPVFKIENVLTKEGTPANEIIKRKVQAELEAKKEALKVEAERAAKRAQDSLAAIVDDKLVKGEAALDSLIAEQTDSLSRELLEKLGIEEKKDSTVEEVKEKAKSVLKGLLKRKNKKKKDTIKN